MEKTTEVGSPSPCFAGMGTGESNTEPDPDPDPLGRVGKLINKKGEKLTTYFIFSNF